MKKQQKKKKEKEKATKERVNLFESVYWNFVFKLSQEVKKKRRQRRNKFTK